MQRLFRPWLKSISGLFINISAVWFTLAFITPTFDKNNTLILTVDISFGILFLLASVFIEAILDYE